MATGQHKKQPQTACQIIKTENGLVVDPTAVEEAITAWGVRKTITPEGDRRTGKNLPNEAERSYPFDTITEPNHKKYKELLDMSRTEASRKWMHHIICVEHAFNTCLNTLRSAKAWGPDGVVNEVIQALPPAGKRAIHDLIKLMWATGLTPTSWKASDTVLLYKHKGTPLELDYYRRIGLEHTTYKVWTRMVAIAMADVAEKYHMLSNSQAGFRNRRSATQQLEMMVMALEDAYLTKQDTHICIYIYRWLKCRKLLTPSHMTNFL